MPTAFKRFDVKHGISVNGLPFVDAERNIIVRDLTVQGTSTIVDTRTITSVDPIISLGASGKTYTAESIAVGTPAAEGLPAVPSKIKFYAEEFADIAVGDSVKYETAGTPPTGLVSGNIYYIISKNANVTSDEYRTVQISSTQGGVVGVVTTTEGSGNQNFTLNPLQDLSQDLGIEFNYVDTTAKKGFFGYKDTTGHFTFLLNTTYSGSTFQSDVGTPVFTGTKSGIDVRNIKLEPTVALTSNIPAIDIDQTWNNAGTIFKAFEIDIIDTASNPTSNLLDIAVVTPGTPEIPGTPATPAVTAQRLLLRKDGALSINDSLYGAVLNVNKGSIADSILIKGTATWNALGTTFKGIDLQVTATAFAAGSKLVNFYATALRYLSVDAFGKIDSKITFQDQEAGTQLLHTAFKVDVTDTSSHTSSLLLDLQKGGVSKFNVDKNGNVSAKGNITVDGSASFENHIDIQARANDSETGTYEDNTRFQTSYVTILAGTSTATTINTFLKADYVTGKYLIQVKQGTNNYHAAEVLLLHNGTDVFMTEYAAVYNSSILGVFDAAISGVNLNLTFTPTAAAVAASAIIGVRITRILMRA